MLSLDLSSSTSAHSRSPEQTCLHARPTTLHILGACQIWFSHGRPKPILTRVPWLDPGSLLQSPMPHCLIKFGQAVNQSTVGAKSWTCAEVL